MPLSSWIFNCDIPANHQYAHSLPLSADLWSRRPFKRFHHECFLFHLAHQRGVGMVADNAGELRMVIAHDARAVDDHILHMPITDFVD